MSSDFAVEYGRLEDYGNQLSQVATGISGTLNATRVDSPSSATSGGLAAVAAGALQWRWESAARRVSEHLSQHAGRLKTNAADYRLIEDTNEGLVRESFGER